MELASEIGLCLNVGGIRPEGPADALTRNRPPPPVEHEEGDELLLPRARKTGNRAAINPNIKPAEQINAKRGCACHTSKITRECSLSRILKRIGTLASVEPTLSLFINPSRSDLT